MKAVIQRVLSAKVETGGEIVGSIEKGLMILLGVAKNDTEGNAEKLARKITGMRIFDDEKGKLNFSAANINGGILVVSNFTLCADCAHGNRPDFMAAADFSKARELYLDFIGAINKNGISKCETGRFGADMKVSLECDGPVTIILDTAAFPQKND